MGITEHEVEQFEFLRAAIQDNCCAVLKSETIDGKSVNVVCVIMHGDKVIASKDDLLGDNSDVTVHPLAVLFDENMEKFIKATDGAEPVGE